MVALAQPPFEKLILSVRQGLLPVGNAHNTSPGRHPGGIGKRCPSHLCWLLSIWRSSGSTPSSSYQSHRVTELLTKSLRVTQFPHPVPIGALVPTTL